MCFLTSYLCIPVPYNEKDIFWGVNSKRFCRSSQNRSTLASSGLLVGAWAWIAVTLNGLSWKRTKIILSFLRLHPSTAFQTLVDYRGYCISSKGFLPTVVDIMVIWVKFTHSSPSQFADSWNVDAHPCHLLFDHFQVALIHGPNISGSYAILLFTASDLASITSHIHSWVLFLLWLHPFILSGVISPLISSSILGT